MDFNQQRILGRTGLTVGRLGVACSYGAPTEAFEEAFERGVNYFYWGSTRKEAMARAIRNIIAGGRRDRLVILLQSYSRSAFLMETLFQRGLKTLGIDTADILLLGWYNRPPSPRILERAERMREKGMFRYLAVSGHNRPLFPDLAADSKYDLFHARYNAAHRGAETEIFPKLPAENRPGMVTYTATRWGDLVKAKKMPSGQAPLSGADCYRFVLSNPDVDVCMTGPRSTAEMREALRALDLGPMDAAEMARTRKIGDYVHDNSRRLFA
ncbi:MAG: aldo/keto reductase [Desulfobacterales bacterium]|nr:aldo/keto reductase [Desulfobacterales bacterium]